MFRSELYAVGRHSRASRGNAMKVPALCLLLLVTGQVFAADPVYAWRKLTDDPDRVYLYRDGVQIGGWCYRDTCYRPFDGKTWGPPTDVAPVPPPAASHGLDRPLYVFGLQFNAGLFAQIELHGGRTDMVATEDLTKELTVRGSASLFLAERARFIEKLRVESYSKVVLALLTIEVEDDDPRWQPALGNGAFESVPISPATSPNKDTEPYTPTVLLMLGHTVRSTRTRAAEPVVAHCSFAYLAQKDGRGVLKTMSFDLYLEKVELRKDSSTFPWKVRNVEYK